MKHLNLHEGSQCFVSNSILAENQQILVENHLSAPWKFVKKHQPTKLKPLKHLKKKHGPPQQNWIAFGCFSYFLDILKFLVKTFETLQLGFQNLEIPRNAFFLHVILNQLLQLTNLLRFQPACLGLSEAIQKQRIQRRWFDWWSCKKTAVKFKFNNLFRERTFFLPKIYNLGDTFSTKSHLMTVEASPRVALKAVANKNPMPCWNIGGHPNRGHCLLWHWICVPSRCSWRCDTFGFPDRGEQGR